MHRGRFRPANSLRCFGTVAGVVELGVLPYWAAATLMTALMTAFNDSAQRF